MESVGRTLAWWMVLVSRHSGAVILTALVATVSLGLYASRHLTVNSDTGSMISDTLPWRQAYLAYEREFPQLSDEIHIVIDGPTPEATEAAQRDLANRLRARPDLFRNVYTPLSGSFYEQNGLLYLETSQLEQLRDNLDRSRDQLLTLEREPTTAALVEVLLHPAADGGRSAVDGGRSTADSTRDIPGMNHFLGQLGSAFFAQIQRQRYEISWREFLSGHPSSAVERRRFIILNPELDYSRSIPAGPAMQWINDAIFRLPAAARSGIRVRVTGSEAIEHESLQSAISSTRSTGLLALLAVGVVLFVGLGSVRLMVASLATLLAGLVGTAAFAAVTVGQLNLISIAFAVLYIGLGIDYAVHLSLGFVEALAEDPVHERALSLAARRVGSSLLLSAVTTAVCFYAFIPTDFSGVSELGLIGGTGMIISLFTTLTLLPALLSQEPLKVAATNRLSAGSVRETGHVAEQMDSLVRSRNRAILILTVAAVAVGALLLPRVWFDQNSMHLSDPDSESMMTYRQLIDEPNTVPMTVSALAQGPDAALSIAVRIAALEEVAEVLTPNDLLPVDQSTKLAIIEEIMQTLGPRREPANSDLSTADRIDRAIEAVADLRAGVGHSNLQLTEDQADAARRFRFLLRRWSKWIRTWPPETQALLIETLDRSLVGTLAWNMALIREGANARSVEIPDLPSDLRERWIGRGGSYRLQVVPTQSLQDSESLGEFVDRVRSVAPDLTGIPVNDLESARVAVTAFWRALALALLSTLAILLLLLRSPGRTAFVLGPLVAAAILTFGFAALVNLPMNFANIITLPLLLGVGVDNGIHIVHRVRAGLPPGANFYATSTSRAVLVSTVTTIASFGSLSVSSHYGLASMGQLLAIGMVALLFCTMVLLPALLVATEPWRRHSGAIGDSLRSP